MALFGELALEKLWTCCKRYYVMMMLMMMMMKITNKIILHSKDSVLGQKE
jgi:hypothetical protein